MPYRLGLDISSAEAQLGQDHATLPPLAALHQINPKAARTSMKATDKDPYGQPVKAVMQETPQKPEPSPETKDRTQQR
jgi:hypothetical protein